MNLQWDKAYVWGWVAILAILTGYELWAVFHGNRSSDPPLTWVTVRYAPWLGDDAVLDVAMDSLPSTLYGPELFGSKDFHDSASGKLLVCKTSIVGSIPTSCSK